MSTSWRLSVLAGLAAIFVIAGMLYVRDVKRAEEAAVLRRMIAMLGAGSPMDSDVRRESPNSVESSVTRAHQEDHPDLAAAILPDGAYRNAGRETAKAAFHTLAWLCDRGEAALLADTITFEPKVKEALGAYHGQIPPEMRVQWPTPERMAAALYVSAMMMRPFPAAAILDLAEEEAIAPGRIKIHLPGTNKDGLQFQHEADGWRLLVTEEMVNAFLAQKTPAVGK